jgi:hypothetical protein
VVTSPVIRIAALSLALAGCGGGRPPQDQQPPAPLPASPLPTSGISGQDVTVYPLTLISAETTLGWEAQFGDRRAALDRADSIIGALLEARSPEVKWVLPPALRRAASQAPGMLGDPDRMSTALLRVPELKQIPDPLRSQMRNLTGVAGGRYALVPASLLYYRTPEGQGRAELTVVIVDVRTGVIEWRTMAHAVGTDPWATLRDAFKTLTPGLP